MNTAEELVLEMIDKKEFEGFHLIIEDMNFSVSDRKGKSDEDMVFEIKNLYGIDNPKEIAKLDLDGYAIGGLAVGEPTEKMYEMIEVVNEILPKDKPRYLMGVGTPANLLEGIERGVDMFDCVMPTRNGRNGMLFTRNGIMNMKNKKWADDFSPIDPESDCFVDLQYSKAYLRHLFVSQELLAMQIASIHNLAFYLWLVKEARKHIIAGDFHIWKPMMLERVTRRL